MFDRTVAPQKGGPTRGAAIFLHGRNTEIMGDPRVNENDEQKKVKVASFFEEK